MRIVTISGLPAVDRSAPVVRDIENIVAKLGREVGHEELRELDSSDYGIDEEDILARYPFPKLLWLPLRVRDSDVLGGMLLPSDDAWTAGDIVIAKRLAETFAHSLALLLTESPSRLTSNRVNGRTAMLALMLVVLLTMIIRVPMTALAPLEITPRNPFIVTAPIESVIEQILVSAN